MNRDDVKLLLERATPTAADLLLVHPDGTPIGCTYSEGDACKTCGGSVMIDLDEYGEHKPGCAAAAVEARLKPAIWALRAAAPAIVADWLRLTEDANP